MNGKHELSTARARKTQQERTSDTREALFEATVSVIGRLGYGGASTALIAQEAGVSRGAILHHFGTRAQLMADTVNWVYERERDQYARQRADRARGHRVEDWPERLWKVLSQPAGIAVLEILQSTRSDPELAGRVLPMQQDVEQRARAAFQERGGWNLEGYVPLIRLLIWTVRGLSIAKGIVPDPEGIDDSIRLFGRILARAAPGGTPTDFEDLIGL